MTNRRPIQGLRPGAKLSITIDRLYASRRVPINIKRAFYLSDDPDSSEQELFRNVAARAVLDALGITGLSEQPYHGDAIVEARQWFRLCTMDDIPFRGEYDTPEFVFDCAGVPFDRRFANEILAQLPPKKRRRRR